MSQFVNQHIASIGGGARPVGGGGGGGCYIWGMFLQKSPNHQITKSANRQIGKSTNLL